MNLRPEDVEQVKFRVALRGYAEDEVDIFLDQVADTIRDLNRQLAAAQREAQELREREALRLQRELLEAEPPAPPPTPEEQPPLPVIPHPDPTASGEEAEEPAPQPEHPEQAVQAEQAEQADYYDLPTQVIEPEPKPEPESEAEQGLGPSAVEEPAPDRPQWGGYSY